VTCIAWYCFRTFRSGPVYTLLVWKRRFILHAYASLRAWTIKNGDFHKRRTKSKVKSLFCKKKCKRGHGFSGYFCICHASLLFILSVLLESRFFENSIILKSSCSHDWVEKLYCQENLQSHLCPKSVLSTSELFIPNIKTLNCSKASCFGLISFPSPFHHRGVLVPFTPIVSNSHLQSTTLISLETF